MSDRYRICGVWNLVFYCTLQRLGMLELPWTFYLSASLWATPVSFPGH